MTRLQTVVLGLCLSSLSCVHIHPPPPMVVVPLEDLAAVLGSSPRLPITDDAAPIPSEALPEPTTSPTAMDVRENLLALEKPADEELLEYRARVSTLERELSSIRSGSVPRKRDWRLSASTGSSLQFTDSDFGEFTTFGASIGAGKLVSSRVLLEAFFEGSVFKDDDTNADSSVLSGGGGGRVYFTTEGTTFPYLGLLVGIRYLETDVGGVDDHDAAPLLQVRLGAETAITQSVYIDYGIAAQRVFSPELFGVEDDITTIGGFFGLAIWL